MKAKQAGALLLLLALTACQPVTDQLTFPVVACINQSFEAQARVEGRLLPRSVVLIGVTSPEDGERYRVLLDGETDKAKWVPIDRDKISFACGQPVKTGTPEAPVRIFP